MAKQKKNTVLSGINTLLTIIQVLLGLKIILELLNANQVAFVQWIDALAAPLLNPFANIFEPVLIADTYVLNLSALFALIAYSAFGYVLIRILAVVMKK